MDDEYREIGRPTDQLIEECAEVIHIICKCQRFGWRSYHPKDPIGTPNYVLVEMELNDLEKRIQEFREWMQIHKPANQRITTGGKSSGYCSSYSGDRE